MAIKMLKFPKPTGQFELLYDSFEMDELDRFEFLDVQKKKMNTEYIPMLDPDGYFSKEQIRKLYASCLELPWRKRIKDRNGLLMSTLECTGGRISEVLQITPADVKQDGINMIVLKKKILIKQKTAVRKELIMDLVVYANVYDLSDDERFFPFTRDMADKIIKKIAYNAGIKKVGKHKPHCHLFRHTLAVNLTKAGAPLTIVQRILKHSSTKITEHYQQFNVKDQLDYLEKV
jgi:integrase